MLVSSNQVYHMGGRHAEELRDRGRQGGREGQRERERERGERGGGETDIMDKPEKTFDIRNPPRAGPLSRSGLQADFIVRHLLVALLKNHLLPSFSYSLRCLHLYIYISHGGS